MYFHFYTGFHAANRDSFPLTLILESHVFLFLHSKNSKFKIFSDVSPCAFKPGYNDIGLYET